MGFYRVGGNIEATPHLRCAQRTIKEADHIQLGLRELPVERPLPMLLARAKLALLAFEKLGKHPSVGVSFKDSSRRGERRPSPGSITTREMHRRERQPREKGGPGTQ